MKMILKYHAHGFWTTLYNLSEKIYTRNVIYKQISTTLNIYTWRECSPMVLLTFLVYYFPLCCCSRWCINDWEAERPTVGVSIEVLCCNVHIRCILTDTLHGVHQGGAIVIDVFNADKDGASDGFSKIILKVRIKIYVCSDHKTNNKITWNSCILAPSIYETLRTPLILCMSHVY